MGRPQLDNKKITARIPSELFERAKSHAIGLGYSFKHGKGYRVDWQGYLSALFKLALDGDLEIPRKEIDNNN